MSGLLARLTDKTIGVMRIILDGVLSGMGISGEGYGPITVYEMTVYVDEWMKTSSNFPRARLTEGLDTIKAAERGEYIIQKLSEVWKQGRQWDILYRGQRSPAILLERNTIISTSNHIRPAAEFSTMYTAGPVFREEHEPSYLFAMLVDPKVYRIDVKTTLGGTSNSPYINEDEIIVECNPNIEINNFYSIGTIFNNVEKDHKYTINASFKSFGESGQIAERKKLSLQCNILPGETHIRFKPLHDLMREMTTHMAHTYLNSKFVNEGAKYQLENELKSLFGLTAERSWFTLVSQFHAKIISYAVKGTDITDQRVVGDAVLDNEFLRNIHLECPTANAIREGGYRRQKTRKGRVVRRATRRLRGGTFVPTYGKIHRPSRKIQRNPYSVPSSLKGLGLASRKRPTSSKLVKTGEGRIVLAAKEPIDFSAEKLKSKAAYIEWLKSVAPLTVHLSDEYIEWLFITALDYKKALDNTSAASSSSFAAHAASSANEAGAGAGVGAGAGGSPVAHAGTFMQDE
jgi:hypothetical protein